MRRLARLDWGAVTVLLLCLVAVWPWLVRPGLPAGTDAEIHVPRVAEFARVLAEGVLYPRWAPDFYLGYGYPLFNFYAPLVYYLAQPIYLFASAAAAVQVLFIVATFVAGLGMYAWVRRDLGPAAAVVSAAAFVFSPYGVLIEPFVRVDLAEFFALALMPWVVWGFDRLLASDRRSDVALAALPLAALALTHNLTLLLCAPFLAAYLIVRLFPARERRAWLNVVGAGALAVGLAAVFWLPALAEKQYVILDQVIGHGDFDFHRHFLTLRELLRPSPQIDQAALNPPLAYNLGLVQWAWAVVGLVFCFLPPVALRKGAKTPGSAFSAPSAVRLSGFMGLAALALGFLTLDASVGVWEAIPLLRYVQFPWRLLGLAALPLAWLAGAGVAVIGERWQAWVAGGALTLLLIGALPTLYPPPWTPLQDDFTPLEMIQLELSGVALGTTANREYTPVWVQVPPHESGDVLTSYRSAGPVDRFDRDSLPAGAQLCIVSVSTRSDTFDIVSPQPFTAIIRRFYFPGWRAKIDGQPVEIAPGEPHGFVTVAVPAGAHTLELRFGSTWSRTLGTAISLVSLLVWLVSGWGFTAGTQRTSRFQRQHLPFRGALLGGVLAFLVAKVAVIDRQPDWFRLTSTGDRVVVAQHTLRAQFEGQIALLGYDLPQTDVAQDGTLPLTLYWQAAGPVAKHYSVFVHLVRPAVHTWGQDDRLNPGDIPTPRWPVDRYVRDAHALTVLPGTPPGEYQIEVGLYEPDTGRRLFVLSPDGAPVTQGVLLPQSVTVTRTRTPADPEAVALRERLDVPFGQIRLLGYDLKPVAQVWPPDFLHVTLFWQARQNAPPDVEVAVRLRDEAGRVLAQVGGWPVDGYYPSLDWSVDELVRDQHSIWLEEGSEPGRYAVEIALWDARSGERFLPQGAITNDGWLVLAWIDVQRR